MDKKKKNKTREPSQLKYFNYTPNQRKLWKIIKMREEIIEIENKTIEKIHEIKSWFFEKTYKIKPHAATKKKSFMLQLKIPHAATKTLCAATKTRHSQINK